MPWAFFQMFDSKSKGDCVWESMRTTSGWYPLWLAEVMCHNKWFHFECRISLFVYLKTEWQLLIRTFNIQLNVWNPRVGQRAGLLENNIQISRYQLRWLFFWGCNTVNENNFVERTWNPWVSCEASALGGSSGSVASKGKIQHGSEIGWDAMDAICAFIGDLDWWFGCLWTPTK